MNKMVLAYLAGAMDSDGSFGIRRSTYAMRVRKDASQPVYGERVALKQITPEIPRLLNETFGGILTLTAPSSGNGHPLWLWQTTDRVAAAATRAMLPWLRVKRRQADTLLELRGTKDTNRYKQISYWFEQENPNWRKMPMMTYREAAQRLGLAGVANVAQCVRNGSMIALPRCGIGKEVPRIPVAMVEVYLESGRRSVDGRARCRPRQLIKWREELWQRCRELNRIGTGDHPIYLRAGPYAPAAVDAHPASRSIARAMFSGISRTT